MTAEDESTRAALLDAVLDGLNGERLEPAEREALAARLAADADARVEGEAYERTWDLLALAAPDVEPPADLRQRLLARVRAAREPFAANRPDAVRPSVAARLREAVAWLAPAGRWSPAALAVMLGLVLVNGLLLLRLADTSAQVRTLRHPGGMRTMAMLPADDAPDSPFDTPAQGMVVIGSEADYGSLVVEHLPPLADGSVYQLWLRHEGQWASGGTFEVDGDGYAALEVDSPRPLGDYHAFMVTVEPADGSAAPTGARVMRGAPPDSS